MPENYTLKLTLQEANMVSMLVRDHKAKLHEWILNNPNDEAPKISYGIAEKLAQKL